MLLRETASMSADLYPLSGSDTGTLILLTLISTEITLAPGQCLSGTARDDGSAFLVLEGRAVVVDPGAGARTCAPGEWLMFGGLAPADFQISEPTRLLEVPRLFLDARPRTDTGANRSSAANAELARPKIAVDPTSLCERVGGVELVRLEGG